MGTDLMDSWSYDRQTSKKRGINAHFLLEDLSEHCNTIIDIYNIYMRDMTIPPVQML